jgi:outer membrane protein TolC
MKKAFLAILFTCLVCGAALAADDAPATREKISVDSVRKERISGPASPSAAPAPRATIDASDKDLPRPPKPEPAAEAPAPVVTAPTPAVEAPAQKAAEKIEPKAPAPAKPAFKINFPWQTKPKKEAPPKVRPPAPQPEVKKEVIAPKPQERAPKSPKREPAPEVKLTLPWRPKPKPEPTPEEKVDRKIQGAYRGEVGFTTVTTYTNRGVRISAGKAAPAAVEAGPMKLNIDDCIKIAELNHIQLMVARKSIKLAEMRLFEARRNMLPTATVVVERSKGVVNSMNYLGRKQYIEGQQPLYHGGELYFTMKQAEVNLQIAKNDYERVRNELILQVKKAYYTLEKTKENCTLQKSLSGEVLKMYDVSSRGYEAGAIARVEYFNVNSQASQVKYQLVSASGDEKTAELILRQAMNINQRESFDIIPSPEFKKVTTDFDRILQDALLTRPEIKANALMITYYNYGRGIANAKSMPKVDFLMQWGLAWEDYTTDTREDTTVDGDPGSDDTVFPGGEVPRRELQPQWYAGIKASMPFWGNTAEYSYTREQWVPVVQTVHGTEATTQSFKFKILDKLDMYSDRQLADIDYDRSRQELNKTKNDVMLEIQEGCFNYDKALIQLETAGNKVKYQEADSEFVKVRRGMDEVQDSAVIDSLIKLAQEKFGYVQAVTDCKISLAALEKAVGRQGYFRDK